MYVGELEGKKMYLSNGDMKKLLERFDVGNVTESISQGHINVACPLCVKFNKKDCKGCTFHKFMEEAKLLVGCTEVVETWTKMQYSDFPVTLRIENIHWGKSKDRSARKFIGTIRKGLLTLRKR